MRKDEPIIISMFCHKGGVGKTTTTREMAAVLEREFGVRVLLIDADPQCNLTNAVMLRHFASLGASDSKLDLTKCDEDDYAACVSRGEEIFRQIPEGEPHYRTIGRCFSERAMGDVSSSAHIKTVVEKTMVFQVDEYPNLHILPGDLEVERMDQEVLLALQTPQQNARNTPAAITKFFRLLARRDNIKAQIILVDLSPSIGAFNRVIIMGSDYVITPALPDYASRSATLSFSELLRRWDDEMSRLRRSEKLPGETRSPPDPEFLMPDMPLYLGYIFQKVKITNLASQTVPKAYMNGMWRFRRVVEESLLPVFRVQERQPNFNLNALPLLKESNSFGILCGNSGVPMSYATTKDFQLQRNEDTHEPKQWSNREKQSHAHEKAEFQSKYRYNIIQLFHNMKPEHQQREEIRDILTFGRFPQLRSPVDANISSAQTLIFSQSAKRATPSTGKKRIRDSENVYKAGDIDFTLIQNEGGGNCALHTLGVDRKIFVKTIRDYLEKNQHHVKLLVPEIQDAFLNRHFVSTNKSVITAWQKLLQAEKAYDDYVRQIKSNQRVWGDHDVSVKNKQERHEIYKNYLLSRFSGATSDNVEIDDATRTLENRNRAVSDATAAYKNELEQNYLEYLQKLEENGEWAGVWTMYLYALAKHINLRFYQTNLTPSTQSDITRMQLFDDILDNEFPKGEVINVLFQNAMHFGRLEEKLGSQHTRKKRSADRILSEVEDVSLMPTQAQIQGNAEAFGIPLALDEVQPGDIRLPNNPRAQRLSRTADESKFLDEWWLKLEKGKQKTLFLENKGKYNGEKPGAWWDSLELNRKELVNHHWNEQQRRQLEHSSMRVPSIPVTKTTPSSSQTNNTHSPISTLAASTPDHQLLLNARSTLRDPLILNEAENILNLPTQAQIQANAEAFGIPLQALDEAQPGDVRLSNSEKTRKPLENSTKNEGIPQRSTSKFVGQFGVPLQRPISPNPEESYQQGKQFQEQKKFLKAFECYQKSAQKNHTKAKTNLALFYLRPPQSWMKQDKSLAFKYFLQAAEAGHTQAMFHLAKMLEDGDGVPQNTAEACRWYQNVCTLEPENKEAAQKYEKLKSFASTQVYALKTK